MDSFVFCLFWLGCAGTSNTSRVSSLVFLVFSSTGRFSLGSGTCTLFSSGERLDELPRGFTVWTSCGSWLIAMISTLVVSCTSLDTNTTSSVSALVKDDLAVQLPLFEPLKVFHFFFNFFAVACLVTFFITLSVCNTYELGSGGGRKSPKIGAKGISCMSTRNCVAKLAISASVRMLLSRRPPCSLICNTV